MQSGKSDGQPKKTPLWLKITKGFFRFLGRGLVTVLSVVIISGCIIGCVLATVILGMVDDAEIIDLDQLELSYTTIIYTKDSETGGYVEDTKLYGENGKLIWADYEDFPDYLIDVTVAAEDKRFWQHQGVDFARTIQATLGFLTGGDMGGGSTITQQLIKNVTGEKDVRIDRKVKEIFNALALEKKYSKQQILEAYLNVIALGYNTCGVQAASNMYYNKDVSELSVAECAGLIAITNNPSIYEPFGHPENNKGRREYIYGEMLEVGYINDAEFDALVETEIVTSKGQVTGKESSKYTSWFIDYLIDDVIDGLMDEYGWDYDTAEYNLYNGGYRVYATVDNRIQNIIEDYYENVDDFPKVLNKEQPNSAFLVLNYSGEVVGIVGSKGEKTGSRLFNIAANAKRHIGSTIKPIASYALAIENDLITFSTVITDEPTYKKGETVGGTTFNADWPVNYFGTYMGDVTVRTAVARSINTIPVKLVTYLTPRTVFDFLTQKLHISTLVETGPNNDVAVAPMALGSFTKGVSPIELAGAYQMIGNGGLYIKPHSYTKVLDSEGAVILTADTAPERVISAETAMILNKLCQEVVYGQHGTANSVAQIPGFTVAGKTGSASDNIDLWFVGMTPQYLGVCWLGYDIPKVIEYRTYPTTKIWQQIMKQVMVGEDPNVKFPESTNVISATYCQKSGDLAGSYCTETGIGWYKKSNIPGTCTQCYGGSSSFDDFFRPSTGNDDDYGGGSLGGGRH
ncbi:MAG: transglycosylase domain-containing protein [Oscillospiraceae bacterium]|nr:transglycosylase domain-containing protein [Oscillospiraceae bacterium]